ncbi:MULTISPECIES: hypothetical protein [Sanguibacteroides]|uniref:Uncharacterized protein n=1 Tax=Sanguibacteroides justesenii TaxID=1547597 RepID=A0AB34R6A9_9PORP|nr:MULTISPECIES: hypothetical protein [Sanguibacteroides]KIO45479.1 hypothetical protein IE90_08735 [Sanguibacteroides justesenii]PXZ44764.1 hypothetical protein DMB45_04825 [Sanguibacteroides justesenii]
MKKTIQLVVLTLVLLIGGISTNVASGEVIYRTQTCTEGETFYVSFAGIFDGEMDDVSLYHDFGNGPELVGLGVVSAYGYIGVTMEDQGVYWFGCHFVEEGILRFEYRLCVILTVVKPVAQWVNGSKKNARPGSLVCIQEKSLVWRSKMLVLA